MALTYDPPARPSPQSALSMHLGTELQPDKLSGVASKSGSIL